MGQFSWITCDTGRRIVHEGPELIPVYVLIPQEFGGGHIEEPEYDGYGIFEGKDIFQLVAQWNAPDQCTGDVEHDRMAGIDIACYDEQNAKLRYPIKIAESPDAVYENNPPSNSDEWQGFDMTDYDDDDEEYYEEEGW